jgi:hypothetical protein
MATLTSYQTRKLKEITDEIELLEYSRNIALTTGVNSSASGISATWMDPEKVMARLNTLRSQRDSLEAVRDDLPQPAGSSGIMKINFI